MRQRRFILCSLLIIVFGLTGINAQEAYPASGGDANSADGSVSYTVGQVFYTTNTGTNGSVAEGVHQPYEISVVTGIENKKINLVCSVYPNPVTDFLTLEVEFSDMENLFYQLYDVNGNLLVSKELIENMTYISMANLAPATYFMKITDNQKAVKTFKIIKTQ